MRVTGRDCSPSEAKNFRIELGNPRVKKEQSDKYRSAESRTGIREYSPPDDETRPRGRGIDVNPSSRNIASSEWIDALLNK